VSHRNDQLTFRRRRIIVDRVVRQRRPKAQVAKEMGVSRRTVAHWVRRFETEGETGFDRAFRPHSSPTHTSPPREQQVVELRRDARRGQDWIGPELGVPARTVSRVLRRHRLPGVHPERQRHGNREEQATDQWPQELLADRCDRLLIAVRLV
jgi:transposase